MLMIGPHYFTVDKVKQKAKETGQDIVMIEPVTLVDNYVTSENKAKRAFEQTLSGKTT